MRILSLVLLAACNGPDTDTGSDSGVDPDTSDVPCELRDADDDGVSACDDCDDDDPDVFPGAPERCNGLDDNCDDALAQYEDDADGDGAPDCASCDTAGYWEMTRDLPDNELDDALIDAMSGLRCGYSAARSWMFTRLDNHGAQVECVYTGRTTPVSGQPPEADNMNTEHTWPRSQGAGDPPMECDLHHLFPTDSQANSKRGSYDFGVVTSGVEWSEGGSKLGRNAGETVFEPRDVHKGNVARAMLYMSLEYGWTLPASQVALFRDWDAQDPVDAAERERSLSIAEEQSFANPLVVCPGVVDRLY